MRGTALILLLALLGLSFGGCAVFDMMLDAGYQSGKKLFKEQFPILKNELFKGMEDFGDETVEKIKAFTKEKTKDLADSLSAKVEARSGVPAPALKEGGGVQDAIADMKRWWADTQVENERRRLENEWRKREGEPPGPKPLRWYEMVFYSIVGGGGLLGTAAVKNRLTKDSTDRRITGYLRNIGILPNGNGTPPDPKKK